MNIGLIDVDGTRFPNLALMKIARYHTIVGDSVSWYTPFDTYDIVYMSKIFNFTPDYPHPITNTSKIVKGGTGYDIHTTLPAYIDSLQPLYSIYPQVDKRTAYGFLTRGCPNKCKWCVVPIKEGNVKPYMDVDDIAIEGRKRLILMDNNILASDYGLTQIEKIVARGYRVDFNQALDARLVTPEVANLLAHINFIDVIRFGCDTTGQIKDCEFAMSRIDHYRGKPHKYLLYTMIGNDINEAYNRLSYFRENKRIRIVAQPFRDPNKPNNPPQWQKDMARWSLRRELYAKCDFKDFSPRKRFTCREYFNQ